MAKAPKTQGLGVRVYVGVLSLVLAIVTLITWRAVGSPSSWPTVALFVLLGTLAKSIRIKQVQSTTISSFAGVVQAAAIAVGGPISAMLVGFLSTWGSYRRQVLVQRAFNGTMSGLVAITGGLSFLAVGGHVAPLSGSRPSDLFIHVLFPLFVANIVMLWVNALLVGVVIKITEGESLKMSLSASLLSGWIPYLGYGVVAFMFAELWSVERLGPLSVVLVIAPLALAQWSIAQQAAEQQTHYRTVETVVAAVEARHPSTRGVSQAVATVSAAIADEMGLRARQVESLRFAAILHDVGLIAPNTSRQSSPGRLDPNDIRQYLAHPQRGVSMIRGIDFLDGSIAAIEHHHERWDGQGYPRGLKGDDIPVLARVVAVAATYVAVLRRRGDASDALSAVRARAGSQLDPRCVDALSRAAARRRLDEMAPLADLSGPDHDDPDVSDLLSGAPVGDST